MHQGALPVDREILRGVEPGPGARIAALPQSMRAYLAHTEGGVAIRAIARLWDIPPLDYLETCKTG